MVSFQCLKTEKFLAGARCYIYYKVFLASQQLKSTQNGCFSTFQGLKTKDFLASFPAVKIGLKVAKMVSFQGLKS